MKSCKLPLMTAAIFTVALAGATVATAAEDWNVLPQVTDCAAATAAVRAPAARRTADAGPAAAGIRQAADAGAMPGLADRAAAAIRGRDRQVS